MWVATVDNIDWPSKRTLSTQRQKEEMIRLLDRAVSLHLNAVVFQVRPGRRRSIRFTFGALVGIFNGEAGHSSVAVL